MIWRYPPMQVFSALIGTIIVFIVGASMPIILQNRFPLWMTIIPALLFFPIGIFLASNIMTGIEVEGGNVNLLYLLKRKTPLTGISKMIVVRTEYTERSSKRFQQLHALYTIYTYYLAITYSKGGAVVTNFDSFPGLEKLIAELEKAANQRVLNLEVLNLKKTEPYAPSFQPEPPEKPKA